MNKCSAVFRFLHDDRGAATTSFILAFPIFLTIVGIVVQMALMVNAKVVVNHAADVAARAAVTSLPDGHPENISQAAWVALAPLSPKAAASTSQSQTVYSALQQVGANVADSFPARYSFAQEATQVTWSPDSQDLSQSAGQPLTVVVTYRFQLTVPGIMKMAQASEDTVAGVHGWFWNVTGTCQVETSHGRKTNASDNGWPQ
jgi:Flp pilus assembly protein TadG